MIGAKPGMRTEHLVHLVDDLLLDRRGLRADDGTLPEAFAPFAEIARGSGERSYEIALRRLRPLDPAAFGDLLRSVTTTGLETSAITAIWHRQADDALEHSVDWSRFWTLVEARWRKKVASIAERSCS